MIPENEPEPRCPVERLLRRFSCPVPQDAADRLLAGLTPERVSCELYWAEVGRSAKTAVWVSLFAAVFGLSAVAGVLHMQARHRLAPPLVHDSSAAAHAPLVLADAGPASEQALVQIADPFSSRPERR